MAALKKSFLVLAVALLALAGAGGTAYAQFHPSQMTCTATAVPPLVRAEGIAELVGDIFATCTVPPGVTCTAGACTVTTNVTLTLNTNITNNRDFSSGSSVTDAVLSINGEGTAATVGASPGGACDTMVAPNRTCWGTRIADNTVQWAGVAIPIPVGASLLGGPGGQTQIRITNVRSNVSQLGIPSLNQFPATQVTAFLSFTGPATVPVTNNVLNVAVPLLGMQVGFSGAKSGLQCVTTNWDSDNSRVASLADNFFVITITEGFATSFKTLGVASTATAGTQWESGWTLATQATRFLIRFLNVPSGVRVRTPAWVNVNTVNSDNVQANGLPPAGHTLVLRRINADSNGASGSVSSGAATVEDTTDSNSGLQVSISGGTGYVVYEVRSANPIVSETIRIPVAVGHKADTANDLPTVGTMSVAVSFAPISTVTTSSSSAPEPRFVDTSSSWTKAIYSITKCVTNLLFPFVTNQAGFDTGFAISNTTQDDKGTVGQAGKCTIYYFGSTAGGGAAPPNDATIVVGAGKQIVWTLSGGNAAADVSAAGTFQGYVMVLCEFQLAHGFAYITDGYGGVTATAQGYLALVVPWDGIAGSRSSSATGAKGESLGH